MSEMDMKEKLVELLDNFNRNLSPFAGDSRYFMVDDNIEQVEYLIINGVTVQKHGCWIEGLDGSVMCSECSQVIRYEIGYYCPKCGAKMDGDWDGN